MPEEYRVTFQLERLQRQRYKRAVASIRLFQSKMPPYGNAYPHPQARPTLLFILERSSNQPSLSRAPARKFSSSRPQNAQLLRRPHRPYQFTALITHSDGSASFTRTTSPQPVYKSQKDIRNHALWNPSSQRLANAEQDEAGRLRAFRLRFGRGWDGDSKDGEQAIVEEGDERDEVEGKEEQDTEDLEVGSTRVATNSGMESLMDLISPGYNQPVEKGKEKDSVVSTKGKGKKK